MKDINDVINEGSELKHFYSDTDDVKKLGMSDKTIKWFDDLIDKGKPVEPWKLWEAIHLVYQDLGKK